MELSVSHQAFVFICMVLCGGATGVIFDLFRSFRRCIKSKSGVVAAQDLVFWLLELSLVYITAFEVNNAQVRGYEAIALIIGAVLYFVSASEYVMRFFCMLIGFFKKIIVKISKPFKKLIKFVFQPFAKAKHLLINKIFKGRQLAKNFFSSKISGLKENIVGKHRKFK